MKERQEQQRSACCGHSHVCVNGSALLRMRSRARSGPVVPLPYESLLYALCAGHGCELAEDGLSLRAIGRGGVCHGTLCNERTLGCEQVTHLRRMQDCTLVQGLLAGRGDCRRVSRPDTSRHHCR